MDEIDAIYPSLLVCFATGCLLWPCLFAALWSCLSRVYTDSLACGTAMRLVSTTHAIVLSIGGSKVMSVTYRDVFYHDCQILDQVLAFTCIYWPYDVVAMYLAYYKEKQPGDPSAIFQPLKLFLRDNKLIVFHHVIVLVIGYPVSLYFREGRGTFLIACVLLTEISSPFVNFRKILIKHGRTSSWVFTVNNALVIVMFFCARVVFYPSFYFIYGYSKQLTFMEVVRSMYVGCHIGMIVIILLQTTWFFKFMGKLLKPPQLKPKASHQNGIKSD